MTEKQPESYKRRENCTVLMIALFEKDTESTSMLRKEGRKAAIPHLVVEIRCLGTLRSLMMGFLVVLIGVGEKVINTIVGTQESAMNVILLWITIKFLIVNMELIVM